MAIIFMGKQPVQIVGKTSTICGFCPQWLQNYLVAVWVKRHDLLQSIPGTFIFVGTANILAVPQ